MKISLSNNNKAIFLALDIGTEAIKSLIFRIENKKPIILGADLKEYYYLGVSDGRAFDKGAMREIIVEVVARAKEQANIKKGKLRTIVGFSGNVLKEKVFRQSIERKSPEKAISDKEEKEIYQKIFTEAREEIAQDNFQRTGITPKDLHFLDFKINEIKIDGFEVESLAGFTGKIIEFEALYIFLPANYLSIGKRLGKELNLDSLAMASKAENLTIALPDPKSTGMFLDIGGETTQ